MVLFPSRKKADLSTHSEYTGKELAVRLVCCFACEMLNIVPCSFNLGVEMPSTYNRINARVKWTLGCGYGSRLNLLSQAKTRIRHDELGSVRKARLSGKLLTSSISIFMFLLHFGQKLTKSHHYCHDEKLCSIILYLEGCSICDHISVAHTTFVNPGTVYPIVFGTEMRTEFESIY